MNLKLNDMKKAYFVAQVTVTDPNTGADVELEVYKHQNGGMFAIDASYLESIGDIGEDEETNIVVLDPFDMIPDMSRMLELIDLPEID